MGLRKYFSALIGVVLSLGIVVSVTAKPDNSKPLSGLEGRIFAVEAEIVYTLSPGDTGEVGSTFNNCYYFNEEGEWVDPLFPDPSGNFVVPGVWVQHTELPKIIYTATVPIASEGLLLIQNGAVNPSRGKARQRLTAYTSLFVEGVGLFVEVVSRGRSVEECPYGFPYEP